MSSNFIVELSSPQELQNCIAWFKERGCTDVLLCPSVGDPNSENANQTLSYSFVSPGIIRISAPDSIYGNTDTAIGFETKFYFYGYYVQFLWQELIRRHIFQVNRIRFSGNDGYTSISEFLDTIPFGFDIDVSNRTKKHFPNDETIRQCDQEIALYQEASRVYMEHIDQFIQNKQE